MSDAIAQSNGPSRRRSRQSRKQRPLILCAIGAVGGLLIAGFGLFTARGTHVAVVPAEDVALVNAIPILRADFLSQLQALYDVTASQASTVQRQRVLNDMIREELYVQRGLELGLPTDDIEVRAALVAGTEQQIAADTMLSRPSLKDLRAWYDAHPEHYATEGRMTLSEYVIPAARASSAGNIVAELRGGESADGLNLRSSGRVDDGEEFYFAAEIHLGAPLFQAAKKLRDGQVSDPVAQADGVHILIMHKHVAPVAANFADVEDQVLADLLKDRVARLQANNERFLRKRADIQIAFDLKP